MAKSMGFRKRFPHTTIFLVVSIALAIPLTVWSLNNVSTNINQEAARGGSARGNSSLSISMVKDNNLNGTPNYKDTVTFNIVTTQTDYPYISLVCYQNNNLVLSNSAGFYDGYPWPSARTMVLSTDKWTSGASDCKATLYNASQPKKPYATLLFHVDP